MEGSSETSTVSDGPGWVFSTTVRLALAGSLRAEDADATTTSATAIARMDDRIESRNPKSPCRGQYGIRPPGAMAEVSRGRRSKPLCLPISKRECGRGGRRPIRDRIQRPRNRRRRVVGKALVPRGDWLLHTGILSTAGLLGLKRGPKGQVACSRRIASFPPFPYHLAASYEKSGRARRGWED